VAHFLAHAPEGLTVVAARDGVFDALPETDDSGPLARKFVEEFRSALVAAPRPPRRGDLRSPFEAATQIRRPDTMSSRRRALADRDGVFVFGDKVGGDR
jgi:hypothetical protein